LHKDRPVRGLAHSACVLQLLLFCSKVVFGCSPKTATQIATADRRPTSGSHANVTVAHLGLAMGHRSFTSVLCRWISRRAFFSAAINLIGFPCAIELTTTLCILVFRRQNAIGLNNGATCFDSQGRQGSIGTFSLSTLSEIIYHTVNSGMKSRKEFSQNSCLVAHVEFI